MLSGAQAFPCRSPCGSSSASGDAGRPKQGGLSGRYLVPLSALPSIQPLETVNQEPGAALKQQEGKSSFANIMREAIDTLRQSQETAAADSYDLAMGDVASLHNMMINSAMEATAVETAVQLTSRAVSAYKEIMQMQI